MEHLASLRQAVATLPRSPGVYLWKDADGEVLYVGKATDLRSRTRSYVQDPSVKGGKLMERARSLDFIAVTNNKEALVLEQTLIKRHRPPYNVRLTDDKQYPYLWLTPGPYPRLLKVHGQTSQQGTWFGPFPDGYGAYHVLHALNDLLPLRRCKTLPTEKCLYYDIGKCIAPCIKACTDAEYDALVKKAKALLSGKATDALQELEVKLQDASDRHAFEDAALLRDQLRGLKGALERQHMVKTDLEDRDIAVLERDGAIGVVVLLHQRAGKVVGQSPFVVDAADDILALPGFLRSYYKDRPAPRFLATDLVRGDADELERDLRELTGRAVTVETPQRGDKVRWLDVARSNAKLRVTEESIRRRKHDGTLVQLKDALGLTELPRIIEGFDISHFAGQHTRAAMVRFRDGAPEKSGYRTFVMKLVGESTASGRTNAGRELDDYASMKEAVGRRLRGLAERNEPLPDLILLDGGPGQLSAAMDAVRGAGVTVEVVAIAKQNEELWRPKRRLPIKLPRDDSGLQLLQRVRDEAHRFGITQVRRKSATAVTSSPLDGIPGIGPKRRAQLVTAFGGLEGLRAASQEDLTALAGITPAIAAKIVKALTV